MNPLRQSRERTRGSLSNDRTVAWLQDIANPFPDEPSDSDRDATFSFIMPDDGRSAMRQVYIRLVNGSKILVPISASATVAELHVEAVRRATRMGLQYSIDRTVLQTTGHQTATMFGDDRLADVLGATEDNTFLLDNADVFLNPVRFLNQDRRNAAS
jgi:hypothetical protein